MEIRDFSSRVAKIFQYFLTFEEKFPMSAQPCNILYMYTISNQEFSIKGIWKFISFDKNPLLRGWKLLKSKWGNTAFGEPSNKGQQMISTPQKVLLFQFIFYQCLCSLKSLLVLLPQWLRGKVALNEPFPTGGQNALNLLKIAKLTQNVRTKSNIETNNCRAPRLFIKYVI